MDAQSARMHLVLMHFLGFAHDGQYGFLEVIEMMLELLRYIGTRNWLRLGVRRRIVQFLHPLQKNESLPFVVPYHGVMYRGDAIIAQEWHVYFFGGYELRESALIIDVLERMDSPVALDIGANLGGHTYTMAAHADDVHAFEPFGPLADRIAEQIFSNAISNIKLHRFGLGDTEETKTYYLDQGSNNSGTGSFLAEHTGADAAGELQIRRGDDWADGLRVDFIKIDVEGFEAPALVGFRETLTKSLPLIMMEVTESSWCKVAEYGGLWAIIDYNVTVFEICNPDYTVGIFQKGLYRLKKLETIVPRKVSFNILLVPDSRLGLIAGLPGV